MELPERRLHENGTSRPPPQPLHSTLAVENGVSAHVVAASLGHESSATTIQSYVKPEAVAGVQQRRVMTVLEGGRRAS